MAAKAGASFASPFVGRLDDVASDGMELIEQICTIYRNYGFDTEVLVASVRHPIHVVQAALLGRRRRDASRRACSGSSRSIRSRTSAWSASWPTGRR